MPDPEIELDRTYTVPLSRAWIAPRYKRTARAVNVLREFAERHMKSAEIKIDSDLNERLWNRGITKPPRRIRVRMTKDEDGLVTVSLPKAEKKEEEPLAPEVEEEGPAAPEGEAPAAEEEDTATTASEKSEKPPAGGSKSTRKKKSRAK